MIEYKKPRLELSLQERDRRWALVREVMKENGLAAVIVFGEETLFNEQEFRYLSNFRAMGTSIVFFLVDGEPLLILQREVVVANAKSLSWISPENIFMEADLSEGLAKHVGALRLKNKRIGLDSFNIMRASEYNRFRQLCPDVELVEVSELLGRIRASKSREEIRLIEEAIRVEELCQRTFLANLKPGMTEEEVISKVEGVARSNGCEDKIWLLQTQPEQEYFWWAGDAIIQKPTPILFNAELGRTRGYGCQAVRTYCWEEPKGEYKRMFDLRAELRNMCLKEFKPGHNLNEVAAKMEDMVTECGFEVMHLGHGLGCTITDLPFIASRHPDISMQKDWTIMPNEVYAFHPYIRPRSKIRPVVWVGDVYLIGEDGNKWLTPFLPGLPEMIPG